MDIQTLRDRFDHAAPFTVGIEEELMLLDGETLELVPRAPELLRAIGGDPRFKLELPAAHVELLTSPSRTVGAAVAELGAARADLAAAARALGLRVAAAGVHPFASVLGRLNTDGSFGRACARYGIVAEAQLVCGLHVHVALGGADATIAVHDALRSRLPELAALAAAAPFYAGRDSGLASVRPLITRLLPRQGVPPALHTPERFLAELTWGLEADVVPEPGRWWWELRPHPVHGTLEVRVCDAQPDVRGVAALAGVVHALVADLAGRHAAGDLPPVAEDWRIGENRWSACRSGLGGQLADLTSGCLEPTAQRVSRMLDELRPAARHVGCAMQLEDAAQRLQWGGEADRQRVVGAERGARELMAWLADRFQPASRALVDRRAS